MDHTKEVIYNGQLADGSKYTLKKNENRVGGGEQHIIILQPAKQELFTLSQTLLTACFQLLHNSFFLTTFYQFKALQLLL